MKVKLTRVIKQDKNKDGVYFKDKNGRPYYKVAIKIEGSDNWYSTIVGSQKHKEWLMEEGKEYSITTSEKTSDTGTVFYNFALLSESELELESLKERVTRLEGSVYGASSKREEVTSVEEEIDLEQF